MFIYDDDDDDDDDDDGESGDDVLCACIRVVHRRMNLALVCGLCVECILLILVDFNFMLPCRV